MKKRTLLAMALAGIMGMSLLAGCSSAADDAISTAGSESKAESTAEAASESAAEAEGAAVDSKWEAIPEVNPDDYKETPDAKTFLPEDADLSGTKEDGTPWKIAFSNYDAADESMAYMAQISEDYAKEYGFEFVAFDAQGDPQKQSDHIHQAITQGCDAVVVAPLNANSCNAAMKDAKDAGLVVINCQMTVSDDSVYDAYCGPDDTFAAQLSASWLVKNMPEGGKTAIIEGFPGSAAQINRAAGFMGVMQGHPEFEVVDIQTANWSTEDAMKVMESYLSKYPDLEIIFSHFDLATIAAMQAAEDVGRLDEITFVSVDGTRGALKEIATGGSFKETSLQDFNMNTELQYIAALALLNGTKLDDKMLYTPNVCITKENAESYGDPGWG